MAVYRTSDEEPAHDVLAADEFALPAPDPGLRHRPVVLPDDPSGRIEPHDILAAEEFAMPAGAGSPAGVVLGRRAARRWSRLGTAAAVALIVIRSRRR